MLGSFEKRKLLINSWWAGRLPVSVHFSKTRKTGCWLTCHYVAVVLKRLIYGHWSFCSYSERFGCSERGGRRWAQTHTPRSLCRAMNRRTPVVPCCIDQTASAKKATSARKPLSQTLAGFAPLCWREAVRWIVGTHLVWLREQSGSAYKTEGGNVHYYS